MRIETMKVLDIPVNVYFKADGALGDPPEITLDAVFHQGQDILSLLSEDAVKLIEEELWRRR